jgi:hypothetical protein
MPTNVFSSFSFKNSFIAFFLLLALIGLIAVVTPVNSRGQGPGGQPTQNVNVVNTPSVNVANTPTVNAEQSGAWSVGITGTSDVQVVNGSDTPVLGRDVDQPARQPFQRGVQLAFAAGQGTASAEFTVPANKRLVIEYVSARISLTEGNLHWFSVRTAAGDSTGTHFFAPMPIPNLPNIYTISQQTRLYASPGSTVMIEARRTINFDADSGSAGISGYLVAI